MPVLKMYIGRVLVDFEELNYAEMNSVSQRQHYQERIAADMYKEHIRKIKTSAADPLFFVDGEVSNFDASEYMPWTDMKMDSLIKNITNERKIL